MARRPGGPEQVERLAASPEAKKRLRVVLETVAGTRSVAEACEELGIGTARFHELREEALAGALASLEPRPPGRPARREEPPPELDRLRREVAELRVDLEASRVRELLAISMPHLLKRDPEKKLRPPDSPLQDGAPTDGTRRASRGPRRSRR